MSPRARISLIVLSVALAAAIALRMLVGSGGLALPASDTVWQLRGVRIGLGLAVGGALAVAGVLMQCLLRNPLASPDILGPSSGAALAVVIAASVGAASGGGGATTALGTLAWQGGPAVLGAFGTLGLVYLLSQRRGLIEPTHLILVGVVVSIIAGAGVMLVQHLTPDGGFSAVHLLLGGLNDNLPTGLVVGLGLVIVAVVGLAAAGSRAMDAATLGDDEARSVGLRLGTLRGALFAGAGLLTGLAVLMAGPIGFVGLVCPHVVRLMLGHTGDGGVGSTGSGHYRPLVIGSAMAGAALIIAGDTLIKAINFGSGRMPLGILTALIGGPVLVLLIRRTGRGWQ